MQHASITVAPDRSAQVTASGTTSDHPDLGSALAQLTQTARDSHSPIKVAIADDTSLRALTISDTGAIAPAESPLSDPLPSPDLQTVPVSAPQEQQTTTAEAASPYPLPSPTREAGSDSYPVGTPFSGPAAPQRGETPRVSDPRTPGPHRHGRPHTASAAAPGTATATRPTSTAARRPASARRSGPRLTVPSIVLIALLVLAGVLFFLPSYIGSPTPETSTPTEQTQAPTRSPLTLANSTTPVPGFASEAAWEAAVPANASVTATSRGVLIVDGDELSVLNAKTGTVRYTDNQDESITFAADTVIDGRRALVWQFGTTARALFDGDTEPVEYDLPDNARLSSAGTAVLIRDGNALSTLGAEELEQIPTPPPGSTPMALDGEDLISAPFDGPVIHTDITTGEQSEVELESPGDGLEIKEWKSAGHGLAISVWGDPSATTSSGHRLQLVVHSLEDGSVTSINEVSSADVGEASWIRGQGFRLAQIGPYLYSMETGLLVLDGTESGMQFGEPRGDLVPGTLQGNPVIASGMLTDAPAAFSTSADLLAVTEDDRIAITRTSADQITAHPAE
jgi:hypothetical protein